MSFYEVVFEGKPKVVRAYLHGLVAGSGHEANIFFSYDEGVQHEGKVERLSELLHVRALDCHVIVCAETSALLKKKAKKLTEDTGLKITAHKHIRSASIEFNFEAFAKRYNDEIVDVFKKLPSGLRLDGYQHNVKVDPAAEGIESYASAHDYEACGSGTVVGRVDLVIALKKDLHQYALIKTDEIILKLA